MVESEKLLRPGIFSDLTDVRNSVTARDDGYRLQQNHLLATPSQGGPSLQHEAEYPFQQLHQGFRRLPSIIYSKAMSSSVRCPRPTSSSHQLAYYMPKTIP